MFMEERYQARIAPERGRVRCGDPPGLRKWSAIQQRPSCQAPRRHRQLKVCRMEVVLCRRIPAQAFPRSGSVVRLADLRRRRSRDRGGISSRCSFWLLRLLISAPTPRRITGDTSTSPGTAENGVPPPSVSDPAGVPQHSAIQGAGAQMGSTAQQAFSSAGDSTASSDMSGHAMFGLETLGYGYAGTLFPSTSGFGFSFGSDQHSTVTMGNAVQEGDLPMPDLAVMDDTLSIWNSAPEAFEWDDLGAYLSGASHGANPSHGSYEPT
ncbi:hypothetical protein L226DRAFT_264431 [Lentinus tigrinus ALCF2SS1-7]|uniref:Uncharacterized protein n=1 Tax=Lentinus tigrinus ALCF2SS1-6 TaxID=1328759 RepID=A0A5C2S6B3_9APHY|nr:hypothetical protein L227DRAFT_177241 [Lentinus tigrinus ALCF2SS1-6]RPD69781.1 hypothetical protein L226DRAFT_264431 [Lentinus tigrinus ALCF2SS1-7]